MVYNVYSVCEIFKEEMIKMILIFVNVSCMMFKFLIICFNILFCYNVFLLLICIDNILF